MAFYRKKPVVIQAIQWDGKNFDEIHNFIGEKLNYEDAKEVALRTEILNILTLEGVMTASKNDFIIKGITGEHYPCKPDIF